MTKKLLEIEYWSQEIKSASWTCHFLDENLGHVT